MIESLSIENLRGIRSGKVGRLAAINVVVGPNNSGKSTLLEALLLLVSPANLRLALPQLLARGGEPLVAAQQIAGDPSKPVRVSGSVSHPSVGELETTLEVVTSRDTQVVAAAQAEGFKEPLLELRLRTKRPPRPGTYVLATMLNSTGQLTVPQEIGGYQPQWPNLRYLGLLAPRDLETEISTVGGSGGLPEVIEALKSSLPGLTDLRIQKLGERFVTHAYFSGGPPIPAYLLGDGAKRLVEIAALVFAKPDETILLEEPEAFQHPRYLREIAKMIGRFAKRGAQYVLTTHSIELIDLLLDDGDAQGEGAPSLAIHRTKLLDGELRVTTLDAATARRLRHELLEDLRG